MKSLYSGVAGMKTHNQRMDVIGNNISNVNTTGYKTSTVTFKDVYYQTKLGASSGDALAGGINPTQIGYGAQLGTVNQVMGQSGFNYTENVYDCAIEGEGFFQVMDEAGNTYYTRTGVFSVDDYGNLVDSNGYIVLGVSGDPSNVDEGQSQRIHLNIPPVDDNAASAEKLVNGYNVAISASAYGEGGNLAFTIVDSEKPYATRSGSNLTIYMDLEQDFGADQYAALYEEFADTIAAVEAGEEVDTETLQTLQERSMLAFNAAVEEFEEALNNAIRQGGVGLEEGVLPLNIEFDAAPPYSDVLAKTAKNTLQLTQPAILGEDGEVETEAVYIDLDFEVDTAGAFGNKYEIDLKTVSGQSTVTAKWKGDVLTITVPENGVNVQDIQNAIIEAAGGDPKKNITVTAYTVEMTEEESADGVVSYVRGERTALGEEDDIEFDFGACLGGNIERVGMDGGADNFFADMATALSTVTMTGGRLAEEQYVDDLDLVRIDGDGVIYGRHPVHGLLLLGRIDLVTFVNPTGLDQVGTSLWRDSLNSGEPQVKIPSTEGAGSVRSGALEMSNVDLAQEFSDMIITQRGYQANSRVITVTDTMLEELINLKR